MEAQENGFDKEVHQSTREELAANEKPSIDKKLRMSGDVIVGIEGLFRVGHWTGIRFSDNHTVPERIETEDGGGVSVAYVQENRGGTWGYAIPGSEAAPLVVHRSDGTKTTSRFPSIGSPSREPSEVPLSMPWILSIGDPLGVDQIGANEILQRDSSVAVSLPKSSASLPDSMIGYDGLDLMIIGGAGSKLLASLSESQQTAITDWILGGGRVLLMLGESLNEMRTSAPWLLDLLPTPPDDEWSVVELDPSAVETFTSTQTPLKPFRGARLPKAEGVVIITGRTTRRVTTPIASEYVVGLGNVTVIAADLDREPFVNWPERLGLVTSLTGDVLKSEDTPYALKNRSTAYDDLAGQMRATLDQFQTQNRFSFSVVSLILIGLIALVGPLDYLLVNRVLGRPLLGWLTFPIMAIAISGFLIAQAKPRTYVGNPDSGNVLTTLHRNRIELADMDSTTHTGTLFAWNALYSHDAQILNASTHAGPSLKKLSEQITSNLTIPYGSPGRSFGAIQVMGESDRLPSYEVLLSNSRHHQASLLHGLPLSPRSSKSIASQIRFKPNIADDLSMRRRSGSELLEGSLENPLPIELLNGILIYRNWVYFLPTRFPVGGRIDSLESLRQKNFRWQLSRQKALESATETETWDPSSIENAHRVAEMMMFHDVVGGSRYTNLDHKVLSFLDLTNVLTRERCVLMGQVSSPLTELELGQDSSVIHDNSPTVSLIRLVMPVESRQR